jgi:hypothetical protein
MKTSARWLLLATCAGVTLGVAARIGMRLIAMQADVSPGFSLGGSLEVVVLGTMVGAPLALIFWACRYWLRMPAWAGPVMALLVFAAVAVQQPPAARSALRDTPDTPLVTAAVFAAVFAVYGLALEAIWRFEHGRALRRA